MIGTEFPQFYNNCVMSVERFHKNHIARQLAYNDVQALWTVYKAVHQ